MTKALIKIISEFMWLPHFYFSYDSTKIIIILLINKNNMLDINSIVLKIIILGNFYSKQF